MLTRIKKTLRKYLTQSGKQQRLSAITRSKRSDARKILLDFVKQGDIASVNFQHEGSIITMVDGRQYWWNPDDNVQHLFTISSLGNFESKETKYVRSILKMGDTAMDIGGNFGWYTLLFSQLVGASGQVHTFEPIPRTFKILQENCKLNHADNVILNQMAVGNSLGEKELYLPDIGSSGSFQLHTYKTSYDTFQAQIITLDEYVANPKINPIKLIKADIEGAELEMLQGAVNVLQMSPQPIWLIEIQEKSCSLFGHSTQDIFDLMGDFGYSPHYVVENGELQHLTNTDLPLPDYNFIFISENTYDHQ